MTVHDSSLASEGSPVTNMTPCLLLFWLLAPQLTCSLIVMLIDQLTHSLTHQLINPSIVYSYMLIPCLLIDYKAPIVLLQILSSFDQLCLPLFFLYLKYYASFSVYKPPS